jgi:L-fucose isomerase-like protein
MLKPKAGLYGVLEKSEEGWEDSGKLIDLVKSKLSNAGMDVIAAKELVGDDGSALKAAEFFKIKDPDILIAVIVTWSFDHLTLTILRHITRPLAILAVPGLKTGSLVGAQQLGCFLTDLNIEYSTFFGPPEEDSTYTPILSYAKAASIKRNMEKGKIGQVGRRCRGMTPASFDEIEVTSLFGPQVENFIWDEVEEIAETFKNSDIEEINKRIKSIDPKTKCTDDVISAAAKLYLALKKIIRENNLIAISLGGYPQYAGRVCLVSSLLGDDGIVSGFCEGDMNSVIAMYLLQEFSGQPVHFGEMLEVNEKENSVITSHCGCCSVKLAVVLIFFYRG